MRAGPGVAASALALAPLACSPPAAPPGSPLELSGYRAAGAELLRAAGWRTDLARAVVPLDAIVAGPPAREDFVPLRDLRFAPASAAELDPAEPVLVHRGAQGVRAWPLAHLLERELALDEVAGVPVAVTLCSLCASARVWDRRLDGRALELAVSGLLSGGSALLYDRGTESLWRQLDGRALVGAHAGRRLRALPAFTVSFGALRAAHPDARVMLAPERRHVPPFALLSAREVERGEPPSWMTTACLAPLTLELSVDAGEAEAVVLRDPSTAPPHRTAEGGAGAPIGSAAAFRRVVDGRALTFDPFPGGAVDRETRSRWNALGEAVAGPLSGRALEPLPQVHAFRFARAASW